MIKTPPPNDDHDATVGIPSSSHNNNEIEESSIGTVITNIVVVHDGVGSYLDSQKTLQHHNLAQSFVQQQHQVAPPHSSANDHLNEVDIVPIGAVDEDIVDHHMDAIDTNDGDLYIQQQKTSSSRIDDVIDVDPILLESSILCQRSKRRNVGRGGIAVVTDTDHELGKAMIRKIALFPFIDIVLAVSKPITLPSLPTDNNNSETIHNNNSKSTDDYNRSLFFNINSIFDNSYDNMALLSNKLVLLYADITTECGRQKVVQKVDMLCKDPQSKFHRRQLRYLIHCCPASTTTSTNDSKHNDDNNSILKRNDSSPMKTKTSTSSHISIDDMEVAMSKYSDAPFFLTTLLYPYMDRTKCKSNVSGRVLHISTSIKDDYDCDNSRHHHRRYNNPLFHIISMNEIAKVAFFDLYKTLKNEYRMDGNNVVLASFQAKITSSLTFLFEYAAVTNFAEYLLLDITDVEYSNKSIPHDYGIRKTQQ